MFPGQGRWLRKEKRPPQASSHTAGRVGECVSDAALCQAPFIDAAAQSVLARKPSPPVGVKARGTPKKGRGRGAGEERESS